MAEANQSSLKVENLWNKNDLETMIKMEPKSFPEDGILLAEVLPEVLVLLVTVNDNEDLAALTYIQPLDGHENVYVYHDLKKHGTQSTQTAIYYIGKYGACPTAIRKILPGSNLLNGASTVPQMAYNCFPSLCAIIGVGVACGVEEETKLCDVLVSRMVTNYGEARIQPNGELPRGVKVLASPYLLQLFNLYKKWPSPESELCKRLVKAGFDRMPKKKIGEILSGPYLIDDADVKAKKIKTFAPEAIGIEMEAAYLFAAVQGTMTDVIIVKAVCDFGDGHKTKKYQPTAALLAADLVYSYLEDTNVPSVWRKKCRYDRPHLHVRGDSGGFSSFLTSYYTNSRFKNEDDQWPLKQPKYFTPLVLIHQEGERSKEDTTDMASATMMGNIDQYISTNSSKTTKDLQEVFSQLAQPYNSEEPCTILVEGSPGIGKSVLLKEISLLWARKKLLTKCDFLFLLHLRDPTVQQIKSVEHLVFSFGGNKDASQSCITQINRDNGKSVTILLDGYDELPAALRKNTFIARLLQRKELPKSAIVVSSRPHASTHLRDNVTCQVEILGFSEEDQTHFIQQSLDGQGEKILQINKYLTTHPIIASLCFVPFNMTILLFIYKVKATLPTSSTELYHRFICSTICRHLAKSGMDLEEEIEDLNGLPQPYSDAIKQLSQFAFIALNTDQIVFSLAEIKEHFPTITDHPNGFGLLHAVEYIGLTSKPRTFNFVHFSVQEFLAAYYIASVEPNEERYILEQYFWSDIHYNTFNFYVALTSGQRPSFKQFLGRANKTITIDDELLKDKLQCLRLYRIFHEASNILICETIEARFTNKVIKLTGIALSHNNLEDLTTLLIYSSCRNWSELNLMNCHIRDHGLQLLHRKLQHTDITIDYLWLENNDLSSSSDSSLSDIIINCKVKMFDININKTVGETPCFFTTILTNPSCEIEGLELYHNNFSTTKWAIELFSSLRENKTMKWLLIRNNNISDDVCGVICEMLPINNTLRELTMYDNPITGQGSQLIAVALKDNNTLELLRLPKYPEGVTKGITSKQEVVNKERRRRGCDVKLEIEFF